MKLLVFSVAAALIFLSPAMAQEKGKSGIEANNWGQEVKAANQAENGYPNATKASLSGCQRIAERRLSQRDESRWLCQWSGPR